MSLPDRPTPEVIQTYINSRLFWTKKWKDSCEAWYTVQKALQHLELQSVLNVGIGDKVSCRLWNGFFQSIFGSSYFTNIDIVQANVNAARATKDPLAANAFLCDVRNADETFSENAFDLILWSHGPEHVYREDWPAAFAKLEAIASRAVILQCPWGSGYDGDKYHLSKSVQRDEFERFGYRVLTCGIHNTRDAGILAWKILD